MENLQEPRYQRREQTPPLVKINLFEAIAAIVIVVIFVVGFHAILPLASYAVYLVVGVALAYAGLLGYHTLRHRQKLAAIDLEKQQALADRERIVNAQEQAKALSLIQPDTHTGNYPIWIDQDGQPHVFQPGNRVQPVPQSLTYSPTHQVDYRLSGKEIAPADVPQIAAPLPLPGPINMMEIMKHWDLSPENLFLALAKGNKPVACSIEDFMHVAHDGPTGSGKTSQWKAELIMLLKADVLCFLANPHFAPISKKGEDWRPIARALEMQELPGQLPGLLYHPRQIRDFLRWLALVEIDHRFALMRAGRYEYPPLYGFIDEWAEQVKAFPESAEYMKTIIRRGRAVDVCVSTNSQGFLVADTGLNSSARENFQTAYDLGSSPASAAAMLDMKQAAIAKLLAQEQVALGKGIALLRNNAVCDPAQLVRLPYADNAYVYYMLGRAEEWRLPEYRIVSTEEEPVETNLPASEMIEAARQATGGELVERNPVSRKETASSSHEQAANVSIETKRMIQRLITTTSLPWGEIAETVGLASEKYPLFRAVVADMGYDTSIRRSTRKGGQ
jgi:hypothetical protein